MGGAPDKALDGAFEFLLLDHARGVELGYEKVVVDVGEVTAFDFGSTKGDLVLAEVDLVEPVADVFLRRPRVKVRRLHFFPCFECFYQLLQR